MNPGIAFFMVTFIFYRLLIFAFYFHSLLYQYVVYIFKLHTSCAPRLSHHLIHVTLAGYYKTIFIFKFTFIIYFSN